MIFVPGERKMADRKFSSVQEEMEYYRSRYFETQQEFDEFQHDSRVNIVCALATTAAG